MLDCHAKYQRLEVQRWPRPVTGSGNRARGERTARARQAAEHCEPADHPAGTESGETAHDRCRARGADRGGRDQSDRGGRD